MEGKKKSSKTQGQVAVPLWKSVFVRNYGSKLSTDQVLDILYWIRQFFAISLGLCNGFFRVEGFLGFFLYFLIVTMCPLAYLKNYLNVNDEQHGGAFAVLSEGFMPSLALYTLTWTLSYSLIHSN
mmetsp:Transcript_795/g.1466  ORF Transcript_795/g.1466 Transcript_795/m.1466 type:complete len:125 (-) Transcript_795:217-591(-)